MAEYIHRDIKMTNKKQHIGIKYGHLTGVKYTYTDTKDGAALWLWRCDCGNEKEIKAKVVTAGRTKTCGNCELKRNLMSQAGYNRAPKNKKLIKEFQKYIRISQRRRIKWALSIEEFNKLAIAPCTLCGTPPSSHIYNRVEPQSIDQGYTVGGCYSRCRECDVVFSKVSISQIIERIIASHKHLVD